MGNTPAVRELKTALNATHPVPSWDRTKSRPFFHSVSLSSSHTCLQISTSGLNPVLGFSGCLPPRSMSKRTQGTPPKAARGLSLNPQKVKEPGFPGNVRTFMLPKK